MKPPAQAGSVPVLHQHLLHKSGEVWGAQFENRMHG